MGRKIRPLAGKKFGHLIVVGLHHRNAADGRYYWKCWCSGCRTFCVVPGDKLVNGSITSCGCMAKKGGFKHGMRYTRLYTIYRDMRSRCENPNHVKYKYYGRRGIKVCEEWRKDPVSFFNWAQSNGYRDDLTIDRIDGDKGYQPDNCRWVDRFIQANNQSSNVRIEYHGVVHTMAEWCRFFDLPYQRLSYYIRQKGLPFEEAVRKTAESSRQAGLKVPDDLEERLEMIGMDDMLIPPPPEEDLLPRDPEAFLSEDKSVTSRLKPEACKSLD